MTTRYVFDTGALIAAERAARFLRLVRVGRARILVPLPVTGDARDFDALATHFAGVPVVSA